MSDLVAPALELDDDAEGSAVYAENLTKYFGSTEAVRGLSFEIQRGSITAVVGPNGAGKSTTFLMLSTLLMPTSGFATVCGFDPVLEPEQVRMRLGYMPDFFGIYDDLRVDEYLGFFASAYGIGPRARDRLTTDLLELVDLAHKRDDAVNALSRGMKQRLCLARALVHDPELLILDEPASGLDPRARVELRALLLELQKMGKTILISSHILSELEEICSHVLILEAGQLVASGSPKELISGLTMARRFRIRLAAPAVEALQRAIDGMEAVALTTDDLGVELQINGDDTAVASILSTIVRGGVPIVGFSEVEIGMEEAFMQLTKGIVR